MTRREQLLKMLDARDSISLHDLVSEDRDNAPYLQAADEALLMFSPEASRKGAGWKLSRKTKGSRIVDAITLYSDTTGKKIFKLSAALEGWAIEDMPTPEELEQAIESTNERFSLLKNAMIKRNS